MENYQVPIRRTFTIEITGHIEVQAKNYPQAEKFVEKMIKKKLVPEDVWRVPHVSDVIEVDPPF